MDEWGAQGVPFLFVLSYDLQDCRLWPLAEVPASDVLYSIGGQSNAPQPPPQERTEPVEWAVVPEEEAAYRERFSRVQTRIRRGDSYLVNLTSRLPLQTNLTLRDLFHRSRARYKLWLRGEMVCFSPEIFVQISAEGLISSCPMKGTLPATTPDAEARLMADPKETAEHATIVDLIRNDLSRVAEHVRVERYRYAERLQTNRGELIQTSSRITGQLPSDYRSRIGEILFSQLPAGSICGAPKPRTLEIIRENEPFPRGFYTGVAGIFQDGRLDSGVLIRFVDQQDGQLCFKAGGGVTAQSRWADEYRETLQKAYVPLP